MTDISEAERLALIPHAQVDLVLKEAEIAELGAFAFSQDRARQRRPLTRPLTGTGQCGCGPCRTPPPFWQAHRLQSAECVRAPAQLSP